MTPGEAALDRIVMLADDLDDTGNTPPDTLTEITARYATWQPRTPLEAALLAQLRRHRDASL